MLAAMEDEGILDTRTGRINRVAKFLVDQHWNPIGMDEFHEACDALDLNPDYFDQEDLHAIERKIYRLLGD